MSDRRHRLPIVVMASGLVVFAAVSVACRVLYEQTEDRLLQQRTNEAAAVLQVSVSQVRAPLDAAAELAAITNGDPASFSTVMKAYVGENLSFSAAALFRIDDPEPLAVIGAPDLMKDEAALDRLLTATSAEPFVIVDLLAADPRRLGYAVDDNDTGASYVVYGERTLGADPRIRRRTEEPFSQLDYAIYLGVSERTDALLGSSRRSLPIGGRRASTAIPFGNTQLTLVMTPIGHLSSDLFAFLWLIVACSGVAVSLGFSLMTRRLLISRNTAIDLATENQRLFDEQRHIAETLQLGLLPQQLQAPPRATIAARYWPAGAASLIGGDFYDAFRVDEHRWGITIGDVCGKGIEAATITGLARHTIRAVAHISSSPSDVLHAVHVALSKHQPPTYCTACFMFVSIQDESLHVDLALGGHPRPIHRRADGSTSEIGVCGSLLGMFEPTLTDVNVILAPGDLLVLYTDGLTDAPQDQGVPIAEVVDLLRTSQATSIEVLADDIRVLKRRRRPRGSADDTALLLLRVDGPGAARADSINVHEHSTPT